MELNKKNNQKNKSERLYKFNKKHVFLTLKMSKFLPEPMKFYYFSILIKFIPLFCITHDININSEKKGISFLLRKFSLVQILNTDNKPYLYIGIIILVFLISIISLIIFLYLCNIITFNGNLFHLHQFKLRITSYFLFFVFYLFCQYEYSIYVEFIFNSDFRKDNKIIYIIILCIIFINFIFTAYVTILLSTVLVHEPLFIGNHSPIVNSINNTEKIILFFSFSQPILQLEFHLKLKYIVTIKSIYRGLYVLYYIKTHFDYNIYYYKFKYSMMFKILQSICFSSCIIEFIFFYDYKNDYLFLVKDKSILIIKLFLEISMGLILSKLYYFFDNKKIKKAVLEFNYLNPNSFNNLIIKFFNMLYYQEQPMVIKDILMDLNLNFLKNVHNPKCKETHSLSQFEDSDDNKCYYCHIYNYHEFTQQMNNFLSLIQKKNKIEKNVFENNFPMLFKYFKKQIKLYIDNNNYNHKHAIKSLFVLITFYYTFGRNYYKCLFILEKIQRSGHLKKSFFGNFQLEFLKNKLINQYKNKLMNMEGKILKITLNEKDKKHNENILKSNFNYKCIDRITYLEKKFKKFLNYYLDIMNIFYDEYVSTKKLKKITSKFYISYHKILDKINQFLGKTKLNMLYTTDKIDIFFNYFNGKIPKEIKNSIQNFFSEQLSSLIESSKDYYIIILFVQFTRNNISFKIKYASDDLIYKLKYNNTEFKNLEIKDLFAKTFFKSYKYTFSKILANGNDYLNMNNFCLIDKNQYVILYDIIATPIYRKNGIDFFIKLTESKEQLLINKNPKKKNNNFKENKNYCGSCFLFTNKSGKIINLSRGFEDFFFLNSEVLLRYNINIMDLFRLEKLDNEGSNFEKSLIKVYENINDIYMREVGQLGEDPFSKVILQINDIKNNINQTGTNFNVSVNYERKSLSKDAIKKKEYYLFSITVKYDDSKILFENSEIFLSQTPTTRKNDEKNSYLNVVNNMNTFVKSSFFVNNNLNNNVNHSEKIFNINRFSSIIIKKFYRYEPTSYKKFMINFNNNNNENNNNNDNDNSNNKNNDMKLQRISSKYYESNNINNTFILNNPEEINLNHNEKNHTFERLKLQKPVQNFFRNYFTSLISLVFFISLIVIFSIKLDKIKSIHSFYLASNYLVILEQTVSQILFKILCIQIQINNFQPDKILGYDNSIDFHKKALNERLEDFLYFNIKFNKFFVPHSVNYEMNEYQYLQRKNYSVPDIDGNKTFELNENILNNFQVLITYILKRPSPVIFYNNSEYFYTEKEIEQSGLSNIDYLTVASAFTKTIGSYINFFNYMFTEFINLTREIIFNQVDKQYIISLINIGVTICFSFYILFEFIYFYLKTKLIFAKYFYVHTQLRFFNNYLYHKSKLILNFIENYSINQGIIKYLQKIDIIDDNEDNKLLKIISSDLIYDLNVIKIKPFSVNNYNIENRNLFTNSIVFSENDNYTVRGTNNPDKTNLSTISNNPLFNTSVNNINVNNLNLLNLNNNKMLTIIAEKSGRGENPNKNFIKNTFLKIQSNQPNSKKITFNSNKDISYINNINSSNISNNNNTNSLFLHSPKNNINLNILNNNNNNTNFSSYGNNYINQTNTSANTMNSLNTNNTNTNPKINVSYSLPKYNFSTNNNNATNNNNNTINSNNTNNTTINNNNIDSNNNNNSNNLRFTNSISKRSNMKLIVNKNKSLKKHKNTTLNTKKTKEEEEKILFNQNGKKLLKKSFLYINFFLELTICLIIFILISIVQILNSYKNTEMLRDIISTRDYIFAQFNFITELLIIYEMSILNNKEITIEYNIKNGKSCEQLDDSYTNRNVFNDLKFCYNYIDIVMNEIVGGKINKNLKTTRKFYFNIISENFCDYFAHFVEDNLDNEYLPKFSYLSDLNYEYVFKGCNMSNNINDKGFKVALESISQNIFIYYNEFINDENKTSERNYLRLNNYYIYSIQIEISKIIRKVAMGFYIAFNVDFGNIKNILIRNEVFLFIAELFIMIITIILYLKIIRDFLLDLTKIQFFSECVLNTLLFVQK